MKEEKVFGRRFFLLLVDALLNVISLSKELAVVGYNAVTVHHCALTAVFHSSIIIKRLKDEEIRASRKIQESKF
jgi:hypothetical protein